MGWIDLGFGSWLGVRNSERLWFRVGYIYIILGRMRIFLGGEGLKIKNYS